MTDERRLLLIQFLVQLGVIASVASVLVRSMLFQRYLYRETRKLKEKLIFASFIALPLAGGIAMRKLVHFAAADLILPGSVLVGLMAGQVAGVVAGGVMGLPALLLGHELLAVPFGVFAGWIGGICRITAPNYEEVWAFSPFIDLELWRWLRNRLDRPFRDWQALLFAVMTGLTLLHWYVARVVPHWLYALPMSGTGDLVLGTFVNVLALAIPIKIWNNTRIERKLQEQQRLLVQARLDALTSQINPHFLFNTLNSVASLVRVNPDLARHMIVKLASILRRLLSQHETMVPLREELTFIDDYLGIEIIRFGAEKLRFRPQIEAGVLETPVPSMLLQPFVENSIRHGLSPKRDGGEVRLRAYRAEHNIVIEIEDDGVGIPPQRQAQVRRSGIGVSNVQQRLQVLYGDAYELDIQSEPGSGTTVRIALPVAAPLGKGLNQTVR